MKDGKYTWNPADYAKNSAAQFEWAAELIGKLKLNGNETLLDIGSGDGKVTAQIARQLPRGRVVGVDSSPGMVEQASASFGPPAYPNLSFRLMDARRLDFSEPFDVVFSNATLHWVIDHRPVLEGVRRVLRKGGRLLFQMGGRGNAREIMKTFEVMMKEPRWAAYFDRFETPYGFYGPEEYRSWLEQAGLQPVRVELIPKEMKQNGKPGLAGWVRTTWLPYLERLPANAREPFISDLIDRYLAGHPAGSDGVIRVAMVRLEVEARKNGEQGTPCTGDGQCTRQRVS